MAIKKETQQGKRIIFQTAEMEARIDSVHMPRKLHIENHVVILTAFCGLKNPGIRRKRNACKKNLQ